MLGLFSAKPDHPLADAKAARRAVAELPALEPAAAIDSAMAWLESLIATDGFRPERRLELILQIDEAVLPQLRRLTREYLTTPRLSRGQEFKLWQLNRGYWAELAAAYDDTLERCRDDGKAAEALKPQLALLCARLLHAYGGRLKWDQFRYGPVDGSLWAACGRAYLAAAQVRLARRGVTLYANVASSTEAEYLKLLVFQASSMDNLLPVEIELAERLIAYFLPHFVLADQVRPENLYWVDAGKPLPPTRLAKLPQITPTLRFFATGKALDAIAELKGRIAQSGQLPTEINFGGQYAPRITIAVLDHLANCWSPKPPTRSHVRHPIKSRVGVVGGLQAIHQRLASQAGGGDATESWVVENISRNGMGAQVPAISNDWLRVGSFVGLQPEGGDNWLIGVIRRLTRDSESVGAVGIETISKAPRAIVADSGGLRTAVVLLDPLVAGGYAHVLIDPIAWEEKIPLLFEIDGKPARLLPQQLTDAGADGAIGRYKVSSI